MGKAHGDQSVGRTGDGSAVTDAALDIPAANER
jgi:hypothetical protein